MPRSVHSLAHVRRRSWLRRAGFAALVLAVIVPVGIQTTGAYFTADASNASAASSGAVATPTGLKVERTASKVYATANWDALTADSPLRNSQLGDRAVNYLLERSSTAEFANPVTVYSQGGNYTPDAGKSTATKMINETLAVGPTAEGPICAITVFRGASCWGQNANGQLGDGTSTARTSPVAVVGGLSEVSSISAGEGFACAINGDSVFCWGKNGAGQLGDGSSTNRSTPVKVAGLPSGQVPQLLATGSASACVVLDELWCWGQGAQGQLGTKATGSSSTAVRASAFDNLPISAIAVGAQFLCVLSEGAVYCAGANTAGQLGTGAASTGSLTAVRVAGLVGQSALASSGASSCSATATAISCWGANTASQLAAAPSAFQPAPVTTSIGSATVAIDTLSMAPNGGCVRMSDSSASCWGENTSSQSSGAAAAALGAPRAVVVAPNAGNIVKDVVRGGSTSCAVLAKTTDGKPGAALSCWGAGESGQWGTGSTSGTPRTQPSLDQIVTHPAGAVKSMVQVVAQNYAMCVIVGSDPAVKSGSARCLGESHLMGTGYADDGVVHYNPETISLLGDTVTDISLSHRSHVCAVSAGAPYCWGQNPNNQLGDTAAFAAARVTYSKYPRLVQLTDSPTVKQIVANDKTSCALTTGGDVWCWGSGSVPDRVLTGVASQISGMGDKYCAVLTASKKVKCWDGVSKTTRDVDVAGAIDVSVGDAKMCAVVAGGAVRCWDINSTSSSVSTPSGWVMTDVEVGVYGEWCARRADQTVWCADFNNHTDVPGKTSTESNGMTQIAVGTETITVPKPWSTGCLIASSSRVVCSGSTWSMIVPEAKRGSFTTTPVYPTSSTENAIPSVSLGCARGAILDTSDLTCSLKPDTTYYYRIKASESVAGWRSPQSATVVLPAG